MNKTKHSSSGENLSVGLLALCLFMSCSSAVSAQQAGSTFAFAGQSIPTEVAVEYATIGGTALSIPVLSPTGRAGGGQVASNRQVGSRNVSVIDQVGAGNNASIRTSGDDNQARIIQVGRNNLGQAMLTGTEIQFDLRQSGSGNQADLAVNSVNAQSGTGVLVQQNGNNNTVTGSVPGGVNVVINQVGNGATADVSQAGVPRSINVLQLRAR